MADLEELKRAAEAATPGPWVVWSSLYEHMDAQLRSADGTVEGVALAEFYRLANGFKNAEFARLANPATILDLISRLEEAEEALEPFIALAKAVTDEGSPDYREWLREANDWMVAFSFAGRSINLGQLRALASLNGGTDAD